uniref:MSP domain-containing protein n=1 Tax=Elaeophora elaphi TaxID=1147741 RepID=A0A0R3RSV3_9BILA
MSHPKEIVFPSTDKPVVRRLLLRNNTKTDFAVKLRTNSPALIIEPSQGFLRAGRIQSISLSFDGAQKALKQSIEIYCRPVDRRSEAECRRWFLSPIEIDDSINRLAQTLQIKTSIGFTPLETVLDLPCQVIAFQAEQHPTYMTNDSDTITARQIDSGTATACAISETELLAMLPPDWTLKTAKGIDENGWNRSIFSWSLPPCGWLEKFFDSIFPPDETQETVAPCGASR